MENPDDDVHLCLRCRTTVRGLDLYVEHRMAGCTATAYIAEQTSLELLGSSQKCNEELQSSNRENLQNNICEILKENKEFIVCTEIIEMNEEPEMNQRLFTDSDSFSKLSLHNVQRMSNLTQRIPRALLAYHNMMEPPFTGLGDPVLPCSQHLPSVSLYKPVDTLTDPTKQQDTFDHNKGDDYSNSLFPKNDEIDGPGFYSKLDYYPMSTAPRESCISKSATELIADDGQSKKNETENSQLIPSKYSNYLMANLPDEMDELPALASNNSEGLRQLDFMTSLELQCSSKLVKQNFDCSYEDEDEDEFLGPPRNYTGGKWPPGCRPAPTIGGKWRHTSPAKDLIDDISSTKSCIADLSPPKNSRDVSLSQNDFSVKSPKEILETNYYSEVNEVNSQLNSPPSYGKGKWLPGEGSQVGQSVMFYCHQCRRQMKSEIGYEKHLSSTLHGKNAGKLHEVSPSTNILDDTDRPVRKKKLKAKSTIKNVILKIRRQRSFLHDSDEPDSDLDNTNASTLNQCKYPDLYADGGAQANILPKLLCSICCISFSKAFAVQHLASLAHIHNEIEFRKRPSKNLQAAHEAFVKDNVLAVVLSSPFCCSTCRFFCSLHDDLENHLRLHADNQMDDIREMYTCSSCLDEENMGLQSILWHLKTPHHLENAHDRILQAQQVRISCQSQIICRTCGKNCRYFREYLSHRRLVHGDSGAYQKHQHLLKCPVCQYRSTREGHLRTHMHREHGATKGSAYNCFICGLTFSSLKAAVLHRNSSEHKDFLKTKRGVRTVQKCTFCYTGLKDVGALRNHMTTSHNTECTPCYSCGFIPSLPCDLNKHRRVCLGTVSDDVDGQHKCPLCQFKNNLLANVMVHNSITHGQPEEEGTHVCGAPNCQMKLVTSSLKAHMLNHTGELPFTCQKCHRRFKELEWLRKHLKLVHLEQENILSSRHLCDSCGLLFKTSSQLSIHVSRKHKNTTNALGIASTQQETTDHHSVSADSPQMKHSMKTTCIICNTVCSSVALMKKHAKIHQDETGSFQCPNCSYSTAHQPHLRRHFRIHTGAQPFACKYCNYTCNNQENLRKHMVKSSRHRGRFMYECSQCNINEGNVVGDDCEGSGKRTVFKSNYAKDLQEHLLQNHPDQFQNKAEVVRHIRSYYNPTEDVGNSTSYKVIETEPIERKQNQKKLATVSKKFFPKITIKISSKNNTFLEEKTNSATVAPDFSSAVLQRQERRSQFDANQSAMTQQFVYIIPNVANNTSDISSAVPQRVTYHVASDQLYQVIPNVQSHSGTLQPLHYVAMSDGPSEGNFITMSSIVPASEANSPDGTQSSFHHLKTAVGSPGPQTSHVAGPKVSVQYVQQQKNT